MLFEMSSWKWLQHVLQKQDCVCCGCLDNKSGIKLKSEWTDNGTFAGSLMLGA